MGRFALIQNSSTSLTRVGSCTRGPLKAVLNMELYVNENNNAFYTHDFIQPSAKVTRPVPCRWQHSFFMSRFEGNLSMSGCSRKDFIHKRSSFCTMEIFHETYNFSSKECSLSFSNLFAVSQWPDWLTSLIGLSHQLSSYTMYTLSELFFGC